MPNETGHMVGALRHAVWRGTQPFWTGSWPARPVETNIAVSFYLFQMASLRPALKGPLDPLMEAWLAWRG